MAYKVTSPIPISEGGTDAISFATIDGTVYHDGSSLVVTSTGVSTEVLTSNGAASAPTFQGSGGSSSFLVATATLTSAQVKLLKTVPVLLFAAPAAGSFFRVVACTGKLVYGGTNPFTATPAEAISLYYNNVTLCFGVADFNTISSSVDSIYQTSPAQMPGIASSLIEGQALYARNPGASQIAGNAAGDNTIEVQILYQVITI